MIYVPRSEEPEILRTNKVQWTNELLQEVDSKRRKKLQNRYRHSEIKSSLDLLFYGKCAYCQSDIKSTSFAHIEHFRPKAQFPELTFEWANLFLSCERCNSKENKGEKFPLTSDGEPMVNPCDDNPDEHFKFEYDQDTDLAIVCGIGYSGLS